LLGYNGMHPLLFLFSFLIGFSAAGFCQADEWVQVRGVVHVQTDFDGSGVFSIDQLVTMAKEKGIDVLIPTDHDLQVMEYGVAPLRNLLKRREERASVIQAGPEKFLGKIDRANRRQKDVLVIPGVQSSPFYYWSGNPLSGTLTANGYRKELLLIGLRSPQDYRRLPIMHRGLSTRHIKNLMPATLFFFAALLICIFLALQKGIYRVCGLVLGALSILLLIDAHPFKSSRFDPYHGDQGIAPYQDLIDYVTARGGLVFWAHPESNFGVSGDQIGPVSLATEHYPEYLISSQNYTGFEALYGDTVTVTEPGKHWDRVLVAYCQGKRDRPAWGIAGADFHGNRLSERLDEFQTIFLVGQKSPDHVLEAMSAGRMYAVRTGGEACLILDRFVLRDEETGASAYMGQQLQIGKNPVLEAVVSASDGARHPLELTIVRGGEVLKSFRTLTPARFRIDDPNGPKGKTFYRLEARGKDVGRLISNPIFGIKKGDGDLQQKLP